jgi:hypothetical protein
MRQKDNGPEQVTQFLDDLDHPLKEAVLVVRQIILTSDGEVTEHIKWKAPSFVHSGDDRITFNVHRDGKLLLIFHRGATRKDGKSGTRLIDNPTGSLQWLADDRASLTFGSVEEIEDRREEISTIVKLWLAAAAQAEK